jgi:hypothetical protein
MKLLIGLIGAIVSWGICMAVFKIVALCCDLNFNLLVASGLWLLLGYLKWFFIWDRKESD